MRKCIYTQKDETNATFTSAEHIFPRCIGGVEKLDKDWVCDEFNQTMSKYEQAFAQEYLPILLSRMIFGTKGRKNHHGQAGVSFLISQETGQVTLGYIKEGNPIIIPQVIVEIPPFNGKPTGEMHVVNTQPEEARKLFQTLANYKGKFRVLKNADETLKGKMLIGYIQKQAYLGVFEQVDENTAVNCAKKLQILFKDMLSQDISNAPVNSLEELVNYHKIAQFCICDIMRVHAKIVFNVLAHLKGQSFALRPEFNGITNAIATGKDISKYVSLPNIQFSMNVSDRLFSHEEHFVCLTRVFNCLVGVVTLYGSTPSYQVILSNHWTEPFEPYGHICDWRNRKEYSLGEYFLQHNFFNDLDFQKDFL